MAPSRALARGIRLRGRSPLRRAKARPGRPGASSAIYALVHFFNVRRRRGGSSGGRDSRPATCCKGSCSPTFMPGFFTLLIAVGCRAGVSTDGHPYFHRVHAADLLVEVLQRPHRTGVRRERESLGNLQTDRWLARTGYPGCGWRR